MKLVWTEPAILDLQVIRDYIARDSEHYAINFIEGVFAAVEKIIAFPKLGRKVPEIQSETIREILYSNYRIIYEIKDTEIIIVSIVHGARDFKNIYPWDVT